MRISKNAIDIFLIGAAFVTLFSVTGIVKAKQNTEKVLKATTVNYSLPFPGVLPDSPFYKIKMARDKLWEFLISDLEKKAYFEILMADKRVSAANNLFFIKNENDLAISTFSKGFKYLEKTPPIISALREKNFNVNNLIDKLTSATLKHESIIEQMIERKDSTSSERARLKELLKNYQDFESKVSTLR